MHPLDDSSQFVKVCVERIVNEALALSGVEVRETTMSPFALCVKGREFTHLHVGADELTCDLRFPGDLKQRFLEEPRIQRHPIPHADQGGWVKVQVRSEGDLEMALQYMKAAYESVLVGP